MIAIAIMADTPEDLAEAVRKLTEPDKLFVSASEVARAARCGRRLAGSAEARRAQDHRLTAPAL